MPDTDDDDYNQLSNAPHAPAPRHHPFQSHFDTELMPPQLLY